MSKGLSLSDARSAVFNSIGTARGDYSAINRIVIRPGEFNIGARVGFVVRANMRCNSMFGVKVRLADFRRRLVAFFKRRGASEEYSEDRIPG